MYTLRHETQLLTSLSHRTSLLLLLYGVQNTIGLALQRMSNRQRRRRLQHSATKTKQTQTQFIGSLSITNWDRESGDYLFFMEPII